MELTIVGSPDRKMQLMRYSRAVTMDAIAACSAQNPVPDPVSMQTPPYSLPASVTRTAATSPKSRSPTLWGFNNKAARCTRSAFRKSGDMLGAYPAPRHGIDDRSAILFPAAPWFVDQP